MASQGHPSRNAPSGPLLVQSLQPIQSRGSTRILPNGSCSGSGTQNMHSATGQYSTHAGEPEHPVHMSLMTATMCGLRFRRVLVPSEIGSYFATSPFKNGATSGVMSGTQPPANWLLPSFSSDRAGKSITYNVRIRFSVNSLVLAVPPTSRVSDLRSR